MTSHQHQDAATVRPWPPLLSLSFGIGVVVTSEFLPAGLLTELAADLGVSVGAAGLSVAVTALAGALAAPTIGLFTARIDRRNLLALLLLLAAAANLIVATAGGLAALLVGRALLGVALSGLWTFAFGTGLRLAPSRPAMVSAAIAAGVSIASVVAVPLAAWAAPLVGWRGAFLAATLAAILAAVSVRLVVPSTPPEESAGLAMMRAALRKPAVLAGLVGVIAIASGHFAGFTYIRVALGGQDPAAMLVVFGVAGVVGNVVGGWLAARSVRLAVIAAPVLIGLSLLALTVASGSVLMPVIVALWGLAFTIIPVATQVWMTAAAPAQVEGALALQVTGFQVGIVLGSVAGGSIVDHLNVQVGLTLGAGAALIGAIVFALARLRSPAVASTPGAGRDPEHAAECA